MVTVDSPYRTSPFLPEVDSSEREVTLPYTGQGRMRLVFAAGMSNLVLRVDPDATALLHARFDGLVPRVEALSGEVSVRYRFGFAEWLSGLFSGGAGATIAIHPGVDWELVFRGGVSRIDADLRGGRVTSIDVSGGASNVDLELPVPDRIVPVRVAGGASDIAVRRPSSVPVGVRTTGGVSSLEVDDRHIDAVGGSMSLASDGWSSSSARFDVRISGGASQVVVTS